MKIEEVYLKYYLPEMADPMFPNGQKICELADIHIRSCANQYYVHLLQMMYIFI